MHVGVISSRWLVVYMAAAGGAVLSVIDNGEIWPASRPTNAWHDDVALVQTARRSAQRGDVRRSSATSSVNACAWRPSCAMLRMLTVVLKTIPDILQRRQGQVELHLLRDGPLGEAWLGQC